MEWMRGYPGNDHALDRLREIVGSGQAIAFVGAGASAGLYPLWGELIGLLIGEAERRGCPAEECDYWRRTASSDPQLVVSGLKAWVRLHATDVGELELAEPYLRDAVEIAVRTSDDLNLSVGLGNLAGLLAYEGRLAEAETAARRALALAERLGDVEQKRDSLACLAAILDLQGKVAEAHHALERANAIPFRVSALFSLVGTLPANLLLHFGRIGRDRQPAPRHLKLCGPYMWKDDVTCFLWLYTRLDKVEAAAPGLRATEATIRSGQQLFDLPPVLLGQADLSRRQGAWGDAQHKVEEALRLAASRRLLLYHADALVLRGRISLDQGQDAGDSDPVWAWRVVDDAEGALALAQRAGYAWAERDALLLRADASHALGDAGQAHRDRADAQMLTTHLQPTD